MHLRPEQEVGSSPGATVAILPDYEHNLALVAVAYCNPHDQFNKKIGREISSGRINAFLKGRVGLAEYVQSIPVTDMSKLKETVVSELARQEAEEYENDFL